MFPPNTHPSRFIGLAQRRMQLRQIQLRNPDAFTDEQRAQLDEITDSLIMAYGYALAKQADEIGRLSALSRRRQ